MLFKLKNNVGFIFRHDKTLLRCFKDEACNKVIQNDILSGVRILDMTRILAGPFCTMILGDLGAEVIKVENPNGGDETRNWGPPFLNNESVYFLTVNRNKKSIAINIKKPEGRRLILELASKSDIFVENFIPGKLANLGLDYDSMKKHAPHLIYCSITGFGQSGPYATRPGVDVIAAAIGGLLHITGPEDGEPCKVGVAMTDLATGLYAHGAILAAYIQRLKSGKGQKIDCDLLSTQVATLANVGSNFLNAGKEAKRWGTAHESIVPYQAFQTKNGHITIGAVHNQNFKTICHRLNIPDFSFDPKFSSNQERVKNRNIVIAKLSEIFLTKTTEQWLEIFEGSGLPYGAVNTIENVFKDPQVVHKDMVVDVKHSIAGNVKVTGPAVTFSESLNKVRSPPPVLAEHTNEILSNILSYSSDTIEKLRKLEVIC